ncbi:hypothetical protein ACFQ8T_06810 [Isoptericola sp. NPDC056618]|uniref:glycoside hydrolase family 38 N-terminal domain-containing protein n=1 Tax=Isoptericola sp. NPDC056618 TaxID=3345878 RepID=UPI0036B43DDD
MPRITQVLMVPHTHHDVGYTQSPRLVDRAHRAIVDRVLDLAEGSDPDGPGAFRWTFEAARPVLGFVRSAPPDRVDRLVRLAREGHVAVTGGYLNMTQLPGIREIEAAYRALDVLRDRGLEVRTVQHGDVNGLAWGAVDAMLDHGLDRLVMALNPDHGRPPARQPSVFDWQGPTGRTVRTLLSTHYGYGEEWGIVDGDAGRAVAEIEAFCEGLEARADWPYATAVVHAANDNRWPTARFLDVVRAWNARHPGTPMSTATADQALDRLEAERVGPPPVLRGEWSDWWSHGHGSTAREVAVYREARRLHRFAEEALATSLVRAGHRPEASGPSAVPLAQVIGYRRGPVLLRADEELHRELTRVEELLALFGEHTWGAWETYSAPDSVFNASHWNAKAGYAYEAYDRARDVALEMLHRGWLRRDAPGPTPVEQCPSGGVVVVNADARRRRAVAWVELEGSSVRPVVADVPAGGAVVRPVPVTGRATAGWELRRGRYHVVVDRARGGVGSLVDLIEGRELVDRSRPAGLGAVVAEQIVADPPHPMLTDPKAFSPAHPGPAFEPRHGLVVGVPEVREHDDGASLAWTSVIEGFSRHEHELHVLDGANGVEYRVTIDKPVRSGPESVFVTFPFAVPQPRFLLETAGAVYEAGAEQLPDTSMDWFSIQHAVGVVGAEAGVVWTTTDAPLVRLGRQPIGAWSRRWEPADGTVDSWVMNNLHFTNFQARQGGRTTFSYRFAPAAAGEVSASAVAVAGHDAAHPLVARALLDGERVEGVGADVGLDVDAGDAVLVERAAGPQGEVRVTLRNTGAAESLAVVRSAGGERRVVVPPRTAVVVATAAVTTAFAASL